MDYLTPCSFADDALGTTRPAIAYVAQHYIPVRVSLWSSISTTVMHQVRLTRSGADRPTSCPAEDGRHTCRRRGGYRTTIRSCAQGLLSKTCCFLVRKSPVEQDTLAGLDLARSHFVNDQEREYGSLASPYVRVPGVPIQTRYLSGS